MRPEIDFTRVTPADEFSTEDAEEQKLLEEMIVRGRAFLESFDWCGHIVESYIGDLAVGEVVAVLLFRIDPTRDDIDEWLWVVVGDLPPAYLVLDRAPTPVAALEGYIDEMQRWVDAVIAEESVEGLIPVEKAGGMESLEATRELAEKLESRLRFLERKILPEFT